MSKERAEQELVSALWGFKETGRGYPCYFCGIVTTLRNAEDFTVCDRCQREDTELGYEQMSKKYPLRGKDERNPDFFRAQDESHHARAEKITEAELKLIEERGAGWDKEAVKNFRAGTITDEEKVFLGGSAEQYIDDWGE